MKNWCHTFLFVVMYAFVDGAPAYELYTHAAITREAYERSVLVDPVVLDDMGLNAVSGYLGADYFDLRNGVARSRTKNAFEQKIIRDVGADELTLQGWLMRGTIREDDIPSPLGENPQDVPAPDEPFYRVFNHFYDPVYNRPLTVPAAFSNVLESLNKGTVHTAVDWATGSTDSFAAPNTPNTNRRNHFTLADAREAMYRAATGRDSAGNPNIGPNNTPATEAVRKTYWATVFRSLGDVVHLVQDMGQPQHTRNDGHSPVNKAVQGDHIGIFEELTEHRAGGDTFKCFDGNGASGAPSLVFSNYAVPTFSSYSEAFSTTPGGNVAQGHGLADYSNRGFFSAGKNLGNTEYALPSSNPADYSRQTVTDPNPCLPIGRQAEILRGAVPDLVGGSNSNVALTSRGLWDVPGYTIPREEAKYSMNETVYYENADLLVTRAASYSAGIINYFFRGKIDFVKDPQNNAQYIIRNLGSEEMEGVFALYYDDINGIRNPVPGASWQLNLAPGQDSAPVSFTAPTNPPPADSIYYLVFNGRMGNESPSTNSVGAVAVKMVNFVTLYSAQYDDDWNLVSWYQSRDLGMNWVPVGISADQTEYIDAAYYLGNGELVSLSGSSISKSSDSASTWSQTLVTDYEPSGFVVPSGNSVLIDGSACSTDTQPQLRASRDRGETWDNCDIVADRTTLESVTRLRDGSIVGMVRNFNTNLFVEIIALGRTVGQGSCGSPYVNDCSPKKEEWDIVLYRTHYAGGQTVKDELHRGRFVEEWNSWYGGCGDREYWRYTLTDSPADLSANSDPISGLPRSNFYTYNPDGFTLSCETRTVSAGDTPQIYNGTYWREETGWPNSNTGNTITGTPFTPPSVEGPEYSYAISTDDGATWTYPSGATFDDGGDSGTFYLASSVQCDGDVLVNPPYRSLDRGVTWNYIDTMPALYEVVYMGSGVLLGSDYSDVYRSIDCGATWAMVNSGLQNPWQLKRISDGQAVLIAYVDDWLANVYYTRDAGLTWSLRGRVGNGFDAMPIVVGAD